MDELRDLFESEELSAAVAAIEAFQKRFPTGKPPVTDRNFSDLALNRTFQAPVVLKYLLDQEHGNLGHKEILAAGFAGWLLFPKRQEIRMAWMTHAMIDHLDEGERRAGLAEQPWSLSRDIVARYGLVGSAFLDEVYNNFGGYQAFSRSTALEVIDEILRNDIKSIRTIVSVLTYLHVAADLYVRGANQIKPSLARALEVLAFIREAENRQRKSLPVNVKPEPRRYLSRSQFYQKWSDGKGTLALLYAADSIKIGRKTLLDVLISGLFSYRSHGHVLKRWVQMARYVSDHVFVLMDDFSKKNHQRLTTYTRRLIGDVDPHPFSPRNREQSENDYFEKAFSNRKQRLNK